MKKYWFVLCVFCLTVCSDVNAESDAVKKLKAEIIEDCVRCTVCNELTVNKEDRKCETCIKAAENAEKRAEKFIEDKAKDLAKKFENQKCDKKYFSEIREICQEIAVREDDQIIKNSKIYDFATKYLAWYKSGITIKINSIKIKKDPKASDNVQFNSCYLHLVNEKGEEYSKERNVEFYQEAAMEEKDLPVMAYKTIKPGETPYLTIHWSRYTAFNELYYNKQLPFNPHTQKEFGCDLLGLGLAYVKVSCSVENGETFPDLLNRVFGTPTPDSDAVLDKEED